MICAFPFDDIAVILSWKLQRMSINYGCSDNSHDASTREIDGMRLNPLEAKNDRNI